MQDEPMKWMQRGMVASSKENPCVSSQCYTYALFFSDQNDHQLLATLHSYRAPSYYRLGKIVEAKKDIAQCRKLDVSLTMVSGNTFPI